MLIFFIRDTGIQDEDHHDPGHYFTATAACEGADKGTGNHDGAADEEASSLFAVSRARFKCVL
jgi:hypothetical protein